MSDNIGRKKLILPPSDSRGVKRISPSLPHQFLWMKIYSTPTPMEGSET
uniref:Uncharacterized protein n=1 Tax=Myoviridae sp. ct3mI7 TaxID=2825028 RepID=A0A8S5QJ57_9CAUD|nr:MAG TPA: hypothetical protein [Myoviridae sp. ct3mI7]